MTRTVEVVYDGEVLRPAEPLDLRLNGRYRVTIGEEVAPKGGFKSVSEFLLWIADNAQDLGIEDLAEQHDHYLYGLPKR